MSPGSAVSLYATSAEMLALWGVVKAHLALGRPIPKRVWRRWYDRLSGLTELVFGDLPFMNYGYASASAPALALGPGEEAHRFQAQLYDHVATGGRSRSLAGLRVLEVGCGRGGGAAYLARHLDAGAVIGVDLSSVAVADSARRYRDVPGLSFQQGDAERLPLPDESVDAVVNVETSHCYPDVPAFLREVRRVLKPGGELFIADLRRPEQVDAWVQQLDGSGMERVASEDITANVAAALDADHERKARTIDRLAIPAFLRSSLKQFTGCRGSAIYENFAARRRIYLRFVLRVRQ